ncbi:MAG: hypothetical protein H0T43_02940 [Solirubrobacterales bacterium]|nr:hypothetical protein [Solirubrobacterales bacterium]
MSIAITTEHVPDDAAALSHDVRNSMATRKGSEAQPAANPAGDRLELTRDACSWRYPPRAPRV